MGRMPWATYLWPGLPQLWRRGSWPALAVAVGFSLVVNLAILANLFWVELLSGRARVSVWLGIVIFWVGSASVTYRSRGREVLAENFEKNKDGLCAAIEQYLKGNWFEAERVLGDLLRRNPRDIEAGLMWSTLRRRQGRLGEAAKELDRIERFEEHRKWEMEIRRERELLKSCGQQPADVSAFGDLTMRTVDAA